MGTVVLFLSIAEDKNEQSFTSNPPICCQGVDRENFAYEFNDLLFESMEQFFFRS